MILPADKLYIDRRKLTEYLLVFQGKNDKSRFLESCGYILGNACQAEAAIRRPVAENEALPDFNHEFGQRYKVVGQLPALAGHDMLVTTVWIVRVGDSDLWRFVTLVPGGECHAETIRSTCVL